MRVDDHIRKEAKRFIHTLKTSRVQSAGRISAAERKNIWPFSDDELAIAPDATWEQVKAALELVGNADEFERLRDEALRLCGVPEERVSDHPMIDHDEAMVEIRAAMQETRRAHGSAARCCGVADDALIISDERIARSLRAAAIRFFASMRNVRGTACTGAMTEAEAAYCQYIPGNSPRATLSITFSAFWM